MKTEKIITGYKFVHADLRSDSGECKWIIGEWREHKGELELCRSGFHASEDAMDAFNYIYGDRFFIIEARGNIVKGDDKFVASEMRLAREINLKKLSVWFSIRCARRCLKYWEKVYPDDDRPLKAIEAAERLSFEYV